MLNPSDVELAIKSFIMKEFLPEENPAQLTNATPLITAGILDSIATLKLVVFLEEKFSISLQAHEANAEYLDTIERITNLVSSKAR